MLELRVLGSAGLEGAEPAVADAVLGGEKRLALLVYLLLAGRGGFVRRDTLLALFWPEASEGRARGALRALVHELRSVLGPGALPGRGDQELAVDRGCLDCDALEFEDACRAGDWQRGLALYRGPLLEGFALPGAPEFEQWLSFERERLLGLARKLAWRTVAQAERDRDDALALDALRQLVIWAPYDEPAVRALMETLARTGDRAAALLAFEQLKARLQSDLEVEPATATASLADALRRRDSSVATTFPPPLEAAPRTPARKESPPAGVVERAGGRRPSRWQGVVVIVLLVLTASAFMAAQRRSAPAGDPELYAILPFSVAGEDSAARALARAIPVLLAARATGEIGPRVLDPGTVVAALPDRGRLAATGVSAAQARRAARATGAGRALVGSVAVHAQGISLHASLLDATTGRTHARASVESNADSVSASLDQLFATLLSRAAGEPEQRLPHLTAASVPALLWYLEGQARLRAARPRAAVEAFARALEFDTTFATAALAAHIAAGAGGGPWRRAGLEVAARFADRLAPWDREVLRAKLGPRHPERSSLAEQLAAWEALIGRAGGQPFHYEVLFGYADLLFHTGPLLGIADAHTRAVAAFERAHRADTTFPGSVQHLADLAFFRRDTASLRRHVTYLLARTDNDTTAWLHRWMLALATADTATLRAVPYELDRSPLYNLTQQTGIGTEHADRVARLWRSRATTPAETVESLKNLWVLALNRGRIAEASALLDTITAVASSNSALVTTGDAADRAALLAALYWGFPHAAAEPRAARLETRVRTTRPTRPFALREWYMDRCVLDEWRLWSGARASFIADLEQGDAEARTCALALRTLAASLAGHPAAATLLDSLDATVRLVPAGWPQTNHRNLLIARLHERHGDIARALAAVRRRGVYYQEFNEFLSAYLAEEARLARLAGDPTAEANARRHLHGLRQPTGG